MSNSTINNKSDIATLNKFSNKNTFGLQAKKFLGDNLPPFILMAPALFLFLCFSIYPILFAIRYCLYDYNGFGTALFVGLQKFEKLFDLSSQNSFNYWSAWPRTILYGVTKLSIEIPLALLTAIIINTKIRGSSFFRGLFYMPQILPGMVMGVVFVNMLNPFNGIINDILMSLHIISERYSFLAHPGSAFTVGITIDVWQSFGINMLFFLAGLSGISRELYESAEVDGATVGESFLYITLPSLAKISRIIILLAMVATFKTTGSYFVLTSGGPNHSTELVYLYIYKIFFNSSISGTVDIGFGSAVAVVSAAILGMISILYTKLTKKFDED
ncbi:MAG: sugar ABC transporter permease [Chitinophagaceae bacterium]|nr:sugar ABC transporter permease [Chitinophagaceae bacterium]